MSTNGGNGRDTLRAHRCHPLPPTEPHTRTSRALFAACGVRSCHSRTVDDAARHGAGADAWPMVMTRFLVCVCQWLPKLKQKVRVRLWDLCERARETLLPCEPSTPCRPTAWRSESRVPTASLTMLVARLLWVRVKPGGCSRGAGRCACWPFRSAESLRLHPRGVSAWMR